MTTSGTTAFSLSGAELVLEAFDRLQIRPSEITAEHMVSARRSLNLVQVRWANRGVNLWKVDPAASPQSFALSQGVATVNLPPATIEALDVYLRLFQMGNPVSLAPAFATQSGSPTVTVTLANHGLSVGQYVNVIVPVAIGGLVVQGFYPVASVPSGNQFTLTAAANATATAGPGGAVPAFTTQQGSASVSVALANHGLVAGATFTVEVPTTVGGLTLSGPYTIATVPDSGHFTFLAPQTASAAATVSENAGQTQIALQAGATAFTDRILGAVSRSDYAAYPNKAQQGPPTVYYFDRQAAQPTLTLWPVPDANGPYQLRVYTVQQQQDANALLAQTPDAPWRFLEAMSADLALHLARKYPPKPPVTLADLAAAALAAWEEAAQQDRERVSTYFVPDFSSYFQ
jgi:hypothetical protein